CRKPFRGKYAAWICANWKPCAVKGTSAANRNTGWTSSEGGTRRLIQTHHAQPASKSDTARSRNGLLQTHGGCHPTLLLAGFLSFALPGAAADFVWPGHET